MKKTPAPRWAGWLVCRLVPGRHGEELRAVLDDEFAGRRRSIGARFDYWRQVVSLDTLRLRRELRRRRQILATTPAPRFTRRGEAAMTSWMQDVRFGLRTLTKTPGLTAVILITLALGMGFYGSTFSLLNTIVRNELPVSTFTSAISSIVE